MCETPLNINMKHSDYTSWDRIKGWYICTYSSDRYTMIYYAQINVMEYQMYSVIVQCNIYMCMDIHLLSSRRLEF